MKKYSVYELINLMGSVEYVGETTRPEARFAEHIKYKSDKCSGKGKFYGRTDITMNIAGEFDNRKDAYNFQCQLQSEYGIKTDAEQNTRTHSEESKKKIGLTSKGRWTGKTHNEQSRKKMSEARKAYWDLKKQNK